MSRRARCVVESLDLGALFPIEVHSVLRRIPDKELELMPGEEAAVQRALPKRRREFAAGRAFARDALDALGIVVTDLPRRPDGRAAWPDGVVGTITHTSQWCAAVVSNQGETLGLGIDIEEIGRMSPGAARQVLSKGEIDSCERSELGREVAWTVRFSAKESIYKCLYPQVLRYIGFDEAEIELRNDGRWLARLEEALVASLPRSSHLYGRYQITPDHVITSCTLLCG